MIINKINISSFGKHNNLQLSVSPNLNIIFGPNESGKTTLQEFIKAMLYGMNSRGKSINTNERTKYTPWQTTNNVMGGEIVFEHNGIQYSLKREFGKTKRLDKSALFNNVSGEEIDLKDGTEPGEFLFDITQPTFENTVFIKQLSSDISAKGNENEEILAKLSNLSGTGDEELSVKVVDGRLKNAMDSLHSPRKDRGTIDKLLVKKSNLIDDLNNYKAIKENTKGRLSIINELESNYADISEEISAVKQQKANIENKIVIRDWNKIKALQTDKSTIESKIAIATDSVTFNNAIISEDIVNDIEVSFKEFDESNKKLEIYESDFIESKNDFDKLQEEIESKSYLEDIDINEIQGYQARITKLNNISIKYDSIIEKVHNVENELATDTRKYEELEKSDNTSGVSSFSKYAIPGLLVVIGLVLGALSFIASNYILIAIGAVLIISGLIGLLAARNKFNNIQKATEDSLNKLKDSINSKKNNINMHKETIDYLFIDEQNTNADNLYDVISSLESSVQDNLVKSKCSDLLEMNHQISEFKTLKIRSKDAQEKFIKRKNKFDDHKQVVLELFDIFLKNYRAIGTITFEEASSKAVAEGIVKELRDIRSKLNEIRNMNNEIKHIDNLVNSALQGRKLDDLNNAYNNIDTDSFPESTMIQDVDDYSKTLAEINEQLETLTAHQVDIHKRVTEEKGVLATAFRGVMDEEELLPLIADINESIDEWEHYYSSLTIAKEVLQESFAEMQQSFGPLLNDKTSDIFKVTTGDKYDEVRVNKDFEIMLKQENDIMLRESDYFSTGALDQLYFSLRIAIVDLIGKENNSLPLFLDDPFVSYDDKRLSKILEFLNELCTNRQIFIFTCHQKIVDYYKSLAKNIGNRNIINL